MRDLRNRGYEVQCLMENEIEKYFKINLFVKVYRRNKNFRSPKSAYFQFLLHIECQNFERKRCCILFNVRVGFVVFT